MDHLSMTLDAAASHHPSFPAQFLWPHRDLPSLDSPDHLPDPPLDLAAFLTGDQAAVQSAAAQIRAACSTHGLFQVINHGIDPTLIHNVHHHMDAFFALPNARKMAVHRKPGHLSGYSVAHSDRFSSNLPWKETFSFCYDHAGDDTHAVRHYIHNSIGHDFQEAGCVFEEYCKEMKALSLSIFEVLGISLGVERMQYRKFFEDGYSVLRGNNYPPCMEAGLTFGTGPHCDPSSLTILHQDQVGGLQVLSDDQWLAIRPRPDAFVVNIGDTFMALCNGKYKSCVHRAVVNKERTRRSLVFFVNPRDDKRVRPEHVGEEARRYPDFTWSDLIDFTQNHYRADTHTLQNFVHWLSSSSSSPP